MKLRKSHGSGKDKVDLQMTPMIDIVFQLLIFFVMTFKIVEVEGDFNIKMPVAAMSSPSTTEPFPPIKVRLTADPNGDLTSIQMAGRSLSTFDALHLQVLQIVGTDRTPGSPSEQAEVELDCDFNLKYENVIKAITAVSGGVDPKSGGIFKLVDKVKFAPPRQ